MKRWLIILLFIVSLFNISGCNSKNESNISFEVDRNGNYTGFSKLPAYRNAKKAVADGCYVKDGVEFKGTKYWNEFLHASMSGENAKLRMVILSENKSNASIDLFYQDGLYYVFKSDTDNLTANGYHHLLILEDSKIVNHKIMYTVILSDDDIFTFTDIMKNLTSSKRVVMDEPYKIVYFGMKPV